MKTSLAILASLAVGMLAGWLIRGNRPPDKEIITHTDTLTVRDTIVEKYPLYVTHTVVDTMLVAVRDTVMVRDTAYVVVEREQRHYQGDDYDAWVSGWRPALDSIRVYPETRYITSEYISVTSRKRWGIGIQAGYGVSLPGGKTQIAPYIGVGISYNFLRF